MKQHTKSFGTYTFLTSLSPFSSLSSMFTAASFAVQPRAPEHQPSASSLFSSSSLAPTQPILLVSYAIRATHSHSGKTQVVINSEHSHVQYFFFFTHHFQSPSTIPNHTSKSQYTSYFQITTIHSIITFNINQSHSTSINHIQSTSITFNQHQSHSININHIQHQSITFNQHQSHSTSITFNINQSHSTSITFNINHIQHQSHSTSIQNPNSSNNK
jgi:hypothetical protein